MRKETMIEIQFSHSVMSDSVTLWNAAHQASLFIMNSWSLLKLMSNKLVMPSSYLILCRPLPFLPSIFPSIRVFSNESVPHVRCQSIGVSASASVLPMNTQSVFPLGLTGLVSFKSKEPLRVLYNTTIVVELVIHV